MRVVSGVLIKTTVDTWLIRSTTLTKKMSSDKCVDYIDYYILQVFGLSVGPVRIQQGGHSRHAGADL